MRAKDITLGMIRNNDNLDNSIFLDLYTKLISNDTHLLNDNHKQYILRTGAIFLANINPEVRKFGYRILLTYSNKFNDYEPLYDAAELLEYIPIVHYIDSNNLITPRKVSMSSLLMQAYKTNFKFKYGDAIYRSSGQMVLRDFVKKNEDTIAVAPTSYGKSDLIIEKAADNPTKNICIIVPSKALLAQTKRGLMANSLISGTRPKIITHPDMYRQGEAILAVLTQERLLRLLQRNTDLHFDIILVDEAHNILPSDHRAKLLAQVLLICEKRNTETKIDLFTPFVANPESVELVHQSESRKYMSIDEYLKVEMFIYAELDPLGDNGLIGIYDQFLNRSIAVKNIPHQNDVEFVKSKSKAKNIVYVNKQRDAENVAQKLANELPDIEIGAEIATTIDALKDLVHEDYNLITCLKKGVVYHHGGLPDVIRQYIEHIYTKSHQIRFIVTTSTLLEGVNIPAERMFLLSPKKARGNLTKSQFKNLTGRVARFNDIFNSENNDLKLLEPHIYLIKGSLTSDTFNPLAFYKKTASVNVKIKDKVENPLLENTSNTNERTKAYEYLENIETGASQMDSLTIAQTPIGKACFKNNIYDFDIIQNEQRLMSNLERLNLIEQGQINNPSKLIDIIFYIFINDINLSTGSENMKRIADNLKARNFYSMFVGWRIQASPYKRLITHFMNYWTSQRSPFIFVGDKRGEQTYGSGNVPLWVDIRRKSSSQLVNLAVAKIKEEQDFVDYNLMQYVEVLHDMELIEEEFYDTVKFGTSDKNIITLLKSGFSLELSKLIVENDNYLSLINIDPLVDEVSFSQNLIDILKEANENPILIFEASSYLPSDSTIETANNN